MSSRVVLDASAALEVVLLRSEAEPILELLESAIEVLAPDLFAAEVGNALWKHARAGDLETEAAHQALLLALALVDRLVPAEELATEALALAAAHEHPVYDALYAVTALRNGATVCTRDQRLRVLLGAMKVPVSASG